MVSLPGGEDLASTTRLIEDSPVLRRRPGRLTAWGLVQALWLRPALAWWRLKATVLALIGRPPGWCVIPRGEAILEHPAHVSLR